jgi:hypothetical protein
MNMNREDCKWTCGGNHAFFINGAWNEETTEDGCNVTKTK